MKMRNLLLVCFVLLLSSWGKIGHRTIGEIAERQLTSETREIVRELLDGQSLAVVSTWADEMRSNPNFNKYAKWHYVNLPIDKILTPLKFEKYLIVNCFVFSFFIGLYITIVFSFKIFFKVFLNSKLLTIILSHKE